MVGTTLQDLSDIFIRSFSELGMSNAEGHALINEIKILTNQRNKFAHDIPDFLLDSQKRQQQFRFMSNPALWMNFGDKLQTYRIRSCIGNTPSFCLKNGLFLTCPCIGNTPTLKQITNNVKLVENTILQNHSNSSSLSQLLSLLYSIFKGTLLSIVLCIAYKCLQSMHPLM